MSGLLKPYAAKKLVSTLKQEIGIPIQLHTHDTTGNQVAALLLAAEAGVDAVDCAISSMAGMTSQPSLNAVVAAMKDTERDTGLDLDRLQTLTDYWEDVRKRYDLSLIHICQAAGRGSDFHLRLSCQDAD